MLKLKGFEKSRIILVIGNVNTGKSYFTRTLAQQFASKGKKVAVICSDVGQNHLGPPSTISMGFYSKHDIKLDSFYFVGSYSPVGFFLPMVIGTKKMLDKTFALKADKVIIDTCGLVMGRLGQILKTFKIEILSPDHIVVFQRKQEAKEILKALPYKNIKVSRLKPSPQVISRNTEERRRFRVKRLNKYFEKAKKKRFSFAEKNFIFYRMLDNYRNLLVGFCDKEGVTIALGIIKTIDFKKKTIDVLTPLESSRKVFQIKFGGAYV